MRSVVRCTFIIVTLLLVAQSRALANGCPISIWAFFLNSIGSPDGRYQYELVFGSSELPKVPDETIKAHVLVQGTKTTRAADIQVILNRSHLATDIWLFPWEASDDLAATLVSTYRPDGSQISCNTQPIKVHAPSVAQTSWHFDDSTAALAADLVIEPVSGAGLTKMVLPDYPDVEKQSNHQGSVIVAVAVGPAGQVFYSYVYGSSGWDRLDKSALKAAQNSLYGAPAIDGNPVAATYLIWYEFQLR